MLYFLFYNIYFTAIVTFQTIIGAPCHICEQFHDRVEFNPRNTQTISHFPGNIKMGKWEKLKKGQKHFEHIGIYFENMSTYS